eukprot:PITA_32096
MEDCRPMATPMITNWKKIDASEDKDVNPTLYRQLIGSLMYLVNTKPNICYSVIILNQFMVELKRAHWAKTKHVLSRKQKFVALSSSKAEYMAASTTLCEAIWVTKLLVNLFRRNMEATRIMCDNQSCIKLSENPVFHDRSKHPVSLCQGLCPTRSCTVELRSYRRTGGGHPHQGPWKDKI